MIRRYRRWLAGVVVVGLAVTACGAPRDGVADIDPAEVPYGVLDPVATESPGAGASEPDDSGEAPTQVYYLDADDLLVATTVATGGGPTSNQVAELLGVLASGPDEEARAAGLDSALGPDVVLRVIRVAAGTAYVELAVPTREPTADQLPLAVGQIVLTVTSVSGVDRVALLSEDERIEIPLPGGERTAGNVTADQYRELVRPDDAG